MRKAANNLEFEKAALLRDRIIELRKDEELLYPLTRFKYALFRRKGDGTIFCCTIHHYVTKKGSIRP